jgi:UDP-N-acetylglucosamine acyltransferase
MVGSHVGHDVVIRSQATLTCNVLLGGHTVIGQGANLGLGSVVHQSRVIGAYSMIGMSSTVTQSILPFVIAFGSPCERQRINRIGLQRSGIVEKELVEFERWFQTMKDFDHHLGKINHKYQKFIDQYQQDCELLMPKPVAA